MFGMEVPAATSGVVSVDDDSVTLDLEGEFPSEEPARHWETEWLAIERKLATNTLVMLTGFSSLVSHATLTRDGRTVRVQLVATHEEALRLLGVALHFLGGGVDATAATLSAGLAFAAAAPATANRPPTVCH